MSDRARRRIVDAHHHLWDFDAVDYPWLMEQGVTRFFGDPAPIQRNYLVAELRDDASGFELVDSVHVQVGAAAGQEVRETEWLQACGDELGLPGAIVAFCDLAAPDAVLQLESQRAFPRVRGVRQIVGRSADEDAATGSDRLIEDPRWQSNLAALAELGLSFDLQLIPSQVERVAEVLSTMPDLRVALCHCGSPWDQTDSGLATWRQGLRTLARHGGVHCKLSGFGMFDHNWDVGRIRPIIESCIDVFGVDRCMFGSNFPVDKLYTDYSRLWRAYEEIAAQFTGSQQDQLFEGTARAFYRLTN